MPWNGSDWSAGGDAGRAKLRERVVERPLALDLQADMAMARRIGAKQRQHMVVGPAGEIGLAAAGLGCRREADDFGIVMPERVLAHDVEAEEAELRHAHRHAATSLPSGDLDAGRSRRER